MRLWMLVGEPGSGKTYFARHIMWDGEGVKYVSRDEIRNSMVRLNDNFYSKENKVFAAFAAEIKGYLTTEDEYISDVIADATHVNWSSRSKFLSAVGILSGEVTGIDVIPIVMTTPVEESIKRNNSRNGRARVPEADIRKMYFQRTHPKTDPFKYAAIMEV